MTAGNDNRPPASARPGEGVGWALFSFEGRIDPAAYWLGLGLTWASLIAIGSALMTVMDDDGLGPAIMLTGVVSLWPEMALMAKRLHDRGWPGWLCLLDLVPVFGLVWTVLLGLIPGDKGTNRYGPSPLDR